MLSKDQISTLKSIAFVSDCLQNLGDLDFKAHSFKLNSLLYNSEKIAYALKVLNVDTEIYTPDNTEPEEINVCIGCSVDIKVIYFFTYLFKELFDTEIDIYISYATNPDDRPNKMIIGSYVTREKNFTNITKAISPSEILSLSVSNMNWEEFSSLFPNENYDVSGKSTYSQQQSRHHGDYDDYDDSYHENDYYDYDEPYMAGDPRYDRDENPWIDVFGPGDEAETAYWNTD
ncbi:hypothetical protein ACFSQD_16940 [Flavihumibacter stibioxidans]|uniref:Uncharacterized protein n=1 Tax=Flavihumibacter stibioxidans TaxID=1834163 RepID=A0ABR7M6M3_9BACT|nr:hypothetical protein [Flavihumibacter stibioxidans]MBC6490665.1 hypothetical protein [Flavihumibacter stibioxidans]